jgi:hypothetical protein
VISDPWNHKQKVDASKVRQAAAAIRMFLGRAGTASATEGNAVIQVELWVWRWAPPGWGWLVKRRLGAQCVRFAEGLLGWRPETEVRTCRR